MSTTLYDTVILPDCVQGNTPTWPFIITVDQPRTIVKAYMTCKLNVTDPDAAAIFQRVGTIGAGVNATITEDDGNGGTVTTNVTRFPVSFHNTSADTNGLPTTASANFDVEVILDNADINTPIIGTLRAKAGVTAATS